MATENVKVIKVDTNTAQTSVKDLRNELKELRSTMLSAEQGTEEYNKALVRSAEIQHTLKEQMEEINASAMDFGQISSNLVKATGELVAGFQAAQAAMNLFGVENEEVLKAMRKMQSLMAITQALPAIDDGIKAFKRLVLAIKGAAASMNGLKAALISTGIGAAVVAVGLLAANWDKVTAAVKKFVGASDDSINKIAAQNKKIKEQTDRINELRGEIAKANGEFDEFIRKEKYDKLNADAKKQYDDLTTDINRTQLVLDGIIAAKNKAEAENNTAEFIRQQTLESGFMVTIRRLEKERNAILLNADSYKELTKDTGNATDAIKDAEKELKILQATYTQSLGNTSLQDELIARLGGKPITIPVRVEIEEPEDEDEKLQEQLAHIQSIYDSIDELEQSFGISVEDKYAQELSALDTWKTIELTKYRDSEEEKTRILERYNKLRANLEKEQTQLTLQRYSLAASGIGDIFNSLGDLMEEGSKEQKAMQIMGATINMLAGITAAIAGAFTTHSGPWDIALAAIQATAIAAGGAATIAQMTRTNKNNASSNVSATPATAAMNSIIAPVQYTQDVQGASIEGAIKDTKVYVTETDITNTQNRVRVSENEARF